MRRRLALLLLLFSFTLPTSAAANPDIWSALAPGIEFQLFHLTNPRPINLFVARLNRGELSATVDSAIAQGQLISGRETISAMAARYNQTINYWGENWGNRSRVVVTINGFYFNLGSGRPFSGQVQSGWYAQRFSDYVGDTGFAWTLYRDAFIGKCVFHTPRDQFLTVLRSGETRKIDAINLPRGMDELVLYTSQYDAATGTNNNGVEVLVEMSRPMLVLPEPAMALGRVEKIRDLHGNTSIPFDHVVLSATGTSREGLLTRLQTGDEIGISQEIDNCSGSPQNDWTKTYAAIGGDYHFLTGGALTLDGSNPDEVVPNSRTAVGYSSSYIYFIVADGWNLNVSEGISISELGAFARDALGMTDAVTLDSGGSSTMVINGQVVNNTYCNFTRQCGMAPDSDPTQGSSSDRELNPRARNLPPRADGTPAAPDLEPLVGNALMMVSVEPKVQSQALESGQVVTTRQAAELRLGPGNNYAVLANIPAGSVGAVLGMHYNDLNGVLATGLYWQQVEFGSQYGWMRQDMLVWAPPEGLPAWFLPLIRR
jgi:hypothetical protein